MTRTPILAIPLLGALLLGLLVHSNVPQTHRVGGATRTTKKATFIMANKFVAPGSTQTLALDTYPSGNPTQYTIRNAAGATLATGALTSTNGIGPFNGTPNNGYNVSLPDGTPPTTVNISIAAGAPATAGNVLSLLPSGGVTFDTVQNAAPPAGAPAITATPGQGGNSIGYPASPTGATLNIYRSTAAGGPYSAVLFSTGSAAAGTYIDNTAAVGTKYFYTAKFANSQGTGPASAEVSATATATSSSSVSNGSPSNVASATPNAAVGATSTLIGTAGDKRVFLQWTNPAQLGGVQVLRRIQVAAGTPLNPFVILTTLVAATAGTPSTVPTSYTDTDPAIVNGTTYDYEVVPTP